MALTTTARTAVATNISAATAGFPLVGGRYGITVSATFGGGSVTLQRLAADNSTYVTVSTYTAAAYETQDIPDGTYRFGVTTATAVYVDMRAILAVRDGGGSV